jgi:phosphodiesterase/alkaline phosphatase D-like protein
MSAHDDKGGGAPLSRREFFKGAGVAATAPLALLGETSTISAADGTPEQIHLTWGDDPARIVFVSWASAAQAVNARVILERTGIAPAVTHAVQRTYTDGLNGQTVFTYHARLDGLEADCAYRYSVTADNDSRQRAPFAATFRTAPRGRHPFRWTSFGDLATPVTSWTLSSPQSYHAVDAV